MSTVRTRNANARKALVNICKVAGYPSKSIKKLDNEWYILHLSVPGGAMIELQTGGQGSTTVYWETLYSPIRKSGEVSFADAQKMPFIRDIVDLAKSLRRPAA